MGGDCETGSKRGLNPAWLSRDCVGLVPGELSLLFVVKEYAQ